MTPTHTPARLSGECPKGDKGSSKCPEEFRKKAILKVFIRKKETTLGVFLSNFESFNCTKPNVSFMANLMMAKEKTRSRFEEMILLLAPSGALVFIMVY